MKFKHDSKMTTISIYAFLVAASAILFYLLLQQLGFVFDWIKNIIEFLSPVIYGFVFAYLLNSPVQFFYSRALPKLFKKMRSSARRGVAVLITYILTTILLTLFLIVVVPQIIYSLMAIGSNVPSYLKSLQTLYYRITTGMSDMQALGDTQTREIIEWVFSYTVQFFENLLEQVGGWLTSQDIINNVIAGATKFTGGVLDIVLGIIISIYLLLDKEKLLAQLRKICAAVFNEKANALIYDIALDCHKMFKGFIVGKIIDSVIVGIICFVIMSLMGLPYAMLISLIVGITNVIPYVGPFIGAVPGFLLVFISDLEKGPMQALLFLVFIFVLQQFDGNVLGPKILGDTIGLSALWVLFSIIFFSGLWGMLGMFIGVPIFAIIYSMVGKIVVYILRIKGKPLNTSEYMSKKSVM